MTLPEAHEFFRRTFGVGLNQFLDGLLMVAMGKPVIDLGRFDDFLRKRHGEYEDRGQSMADVVSENYGQDAERRVSELLGLENGKGVGE